MAKRQASILVVGGGGFIGTRLCERLTRSGTPVYAPSRSMGDLADAHFCSRIAKRADTVYYLAAAKKNIAHHTAEPYDFFRGNVLPLLTFLDALRKKKTGTLVYVSSVLVAYALEEEEAMDGYLLGKLACEFALRTFAKQTEWNVKIVRSAAVYGPGNSFDPAVANFIPAVIQRIKTSKKELTIWGRGIRKLQFIYVDDLVENLIAIGRIRTGGMFTVGNPEVLSVNQITRLIMALMERKLVLRHDLSKADKETKLSRFRNVKHPRVRLKEGLQRTISDSSGG